MADREPTIEEMLATQHADTRQVWNSELSPKQREQLLEAIKADYRRKQRPSRNEPEQTKPPEVRAEKDRSPETADPPASKPKTDKFRELRDAIESAGKGMEQARAELLKRKSLKSTVQPPSTFSVWVQRGALGVAGGIGWWLFEKFDAPVFVGIATVVVCLIAIVGVRWFEKTGRRRVAFCIGLILYMVIAVTIAIAFRERPKVEQTNKLLPLPTVKPDWKESSEAKELASQIRVEIYSLINEGRAIDVGDPKAAQAYVNWVEKCSVVLGRIDSQLRRFGAETDYKRKFDTKTSKSASVNDDRDKAFLRANIRIALDLLGGFKKNIELETMSDRDLIRTPL